MQPILDEYDWCNNTFNKIPKRDAKPVPNNLNYCSSVHPPKCQKHTHPKCNLWTKNPASVFHCHKDWFTSERLLVSCLMSKKHTVHRFTMRWYLPSHILVCYYTLVVLSQENKSTVSDDLKVSLWTDSWQMMLPVEQYDARSWIRKVSLISVLSLIIVIWFLTDINNGSLGLGWKDVICGM